MSEWEIDSNKLVYNIKISSNYRELFLSYLQHRFRVLFTNCERFHYPENLFYDGEKIVLEYKIGLINTIIEQSDFEKVEYIKWKNSIILPLVKTMIECHDYGTTGFHQFQPFKGKFMPPVSYLIGINGVSDNSIEIEKKLDAGFLSEWINLEFKKFKDLIDLEEKNFIENLIKNLKKPDYNNINLYIRKDSIEESSFLDLLTEAEFFYKIREIYRYKIMPKERASEYGKFDNDELLLEIDSNYVDQLFGKFNRPTVQELWDLLIEDRKISRLLSVSDKREFPNPFIASTRNSSLVQWIKTHEDQPLIYIKKYKEKIPSEGFLFVHEYGDLDQIRKKRVFIDFAKNHSNLKELLTTISVESKIRQNYWKRNELANVIINNNGLFAVQGPPGTGKTYLATEVVNQFLLQNKFAKILICSKEHLALDYILERITEKLDENKIHYRAYRSISSERLKKEGIKDSIKKYLHPSVIEEIGGFNWQSNTGIWSKIQDNFPKEYDLRNKSIGQNSASLFFCTTMDSAIKDLVNKKSFDLVIVEEAGKCYPSELFHILCLGRNVLMIGDQNQLHPYQINETKSAIQLWEKALEKSKNIENFREKLEKRFGKSFTKIDKYYRSKGKISEKQLEWLKPFEKLFDILPEEKVHVLEEQFRLKKSLSKVIGSVFYNRQFIDLKKAYEPLKGIIPEKYNKTLLWIDTPHMIDDPDAGEDPEKIGVRINAFELDVVISYLKKLRTNSNIDLVILTPYNDQKNLFLESNELNEISQKITTKPFNEIIRTVDEYQGHEADLTIISLVRNNTLSAKSSWGFISESERLNVMFSRSKSHQVIIGCSNHILRNKQEEEIKVLANFYEKYKEEGKFISAKEFLNDG